MPLDTTKFQHIWQEQAFYNMLSNWVQIENTCQKATWTHGSHVPEYHRCSLGTPGSQQKYLFFDSQTFENNLNNVNIIKVCVPTANDEDEWGIIQRHKYSACVRLKIQKLSPANMTVSCYIEMMWWIKRIWNTFGSSRATSDTVAQEVPSNRSIDLSIPLASL